MRAKKKTVAGTAADPTIRFARVKLNGETYSLAFDFNALALAESITGINLMAAVRSLDDLTVTQTRALFYSSLLKAHESITLFEAGQLLNLRTLPLVTRAIGEAIAYSLPEADPNPHGPGELPAK